MHTVSALQKSVGVAFSDVHDVFACLDQAGLTLKVIAPTVSSGEITPVAWVHEDMLQRIRRFRGKVCLSESVLPPEAVDASGCHYLACDSANYHLVMMDTKGKLAACLRLRFYLLNPSARDLQFYKAIRRMPNWISSRCSNSLNHSIYEGRQNELKLAEAGGYAVAEDRKNCPAAALLPMAALTLSQMMGNALVFEYAGAGPESRVVLRSFGDVLSYDGLPIPAVLDEQHGRLMQVFVSDTSRANASTAIVTSALQTLLEKDLPLN